MDPITIELSALPSLFLATSFIRFVVVLGLLRFGLGLKGVGFGIVTLIFSFALAYYSVDPKMLVEKKSSSTFLSLPGSRIDMMKAVVDPGFFQKIKNLMPASSGEQAEERAVLVTFLAQEIKTSLELGLLFLIPFILVDLLVVNGCLVLGIESSFVPILSLPIKLFLFLSVDGWGLVIERLLRTVI